MSLLDTLATRRREGGFPVREMIRDDREFAVCWTCRKKHPLRGNNATQDYLDFHERHKPDRGCISVRMGPDAMRRAMGREGLRRKRFGLAAHFTDNASVLEAFQTGQTLDTTNYGIVGNTLNDGVVFQLDFNNSSNLYLDILHDYVSGAVNTASSNLAAHYIYLPGAFASADLPLNTAGNSATNSSSTSATLTFLSISASPTGFPLARVVPYVTTNKALDSAGLFGTAKCHDGVCPLFVWLAYVNAAGPTSTTTGTSLKFRGTYNTVS